MPSRTIALNLSLAALIAASTLVLPACKSTADNTNNTGGIHAPDYTGTWTLHSIGTDEVAPMLPSGSSAPYLTIATDGAVTGNAGVNRLSSRFDAAAVTRNEPLFAPVATTKMAGPEPLMSLESRFTQALSEARTASIEAGNLVLLDGSGSPLAVLTPTR